jgi:integrase
MRGLGNTYKRGSIWWIRYCYRGKEYRESSRSESESQAAKLLKRRIGEIGKGRFVGPREERLSFDDLELGILQDYDLNGKRSKRSVELSIRHLKKTFGMSRAVDITTDRIRKYTLDRQQEGAANASINRELSCLKRMFRLAVQAGSLNFAPYIQMLEENNAREGFVGHAEFVSLLGALPEYLKDPIRFLYLSGWRVGEMRSLEWRDVNLPNAVIRLRPNNSKNKQGRSLPIECEMEEIILRAKSKRSIACTFVFHNAGKPVGDFRKAWRSACRAAGLSGIIVHDLRRSAIRNMIRAGIPQSIATKMSGHKTTSTFNRYDIVNEADLADASKKLQAYLAQTPQEAKVVALDIAAQG